jgi:hypothetical protein
MYVIRTLIFIPELPLILLPHPHNITKKKNNTKKIELNIQKKERKKAEHIHKCKKK